MFLAGEISVAVLSYKGDACALQEDETLDTGRIVLAKPGFSSALPEFLEEPYIQREIESDPTGTIRRYLRLADGLLKNDDNSSSEAA